MMMHRILLLGMLALPTAGCATTFPKLSLAAQMRIDEETHLDSLPSGQATLGDATVRVVSTHGLCSGVVVSDAMVLTAEHCVVREAPAPVVSPMDAGDVRVELGANPLPWGRVGVRHIELCPGYDSIHAARDVAVLVLDARLPEDVPRAQVGLGGDEGEAVEAMGYGTGSHVWQLPDFESHDGTHAFAAFTTTRQQRDGSILWLDSDTFAAHLASAHGDSGGPVFSSDGRVVGIASRRIEMAEGVTDENTTVAARVDACLESVERARSWEASVGRLKS